MFYWTRYDLKEKIMLITAAAIACLLFFCISMTSQVNASEQNNAPGLNTASVCSIENTTKGILLEWKKAPGANGYRIFRKEEGFSEWQHIKTISSGNILMWKDKKDMTSGTLYKYLILSGKTGSEDLSADPANGAADENAVSFDESSKEWVVYFRGMERDRCTSEEDAIKSRRKILKGMPYPPRKSNGKYSFIDGIDYDIDKHLWLAKHDDEILGYFDSEEDAFYGLKEALIAKGVDVADMHFINSDLKEDNLKALFGGK